MYRNINVNPLHVEDQTNELLDNFHPGYQEIEHKVLDNEIKLILHVSGHRPTNKRIVKQNTKKGTNFLNYNNMIFTFLYLYKTLYSFLVQTLHCIRSVLYSE